MALARPTPAPALATAPLQMCKVERRRLSLPNYRSDCPGDILHLPHIVVVSRVGVDQAWRNGRCGGGGGAGPEPFPYPYPIPFVLRPWKSELRFRMTSITAKFVRGNEMPVGNFCPYRVLFQTRACWIYANTGWQTQSNYRCKLINADMTHTCTTLQSFRVRSGVRVGLRSFKEAPAQDGTQTISCPFSTLDLLLG